MPSLQSFQAYLSFLLPTHTIVRVIFENLKSSYLMAFSLCKKADLSIRVTPKTMCTLALVPLISSHSPCPCLISFRPHPLPETVAQYHIKIFLLLYPCYFLFWLSSISFDIVKFLVMIYLRGYCFSFSPRAPISQRTRL